MTALEERLDADLKEAMRSGDTTRKLAIRSAKSAIMEARVAGTVQRSLSETEVLDIILKQVKQRRDSIDEFAKGGRDDLIVKEKAEIEVLEEYLPKRLDEAAIRARVKTVIDEMGAKDIKGMGPVMKRLTAEMRYEADGQTISRIVREYLS
jgi:uncharacterized protein YqeY